MKSNLRILLGATVLMLSYQFAGSQTIPGPATAGAVFGDSQYQVVKRGPNSRVWERTETIVTPDGQQSTLVHRYTELTSGLEFLNAQSGQYEDADPGFEITPDGYAIAQHAQHRVIISPVPNDAAGTVDLQTPDGKRLRSTLIALNLYDRASGKSMLVAEVTNAVGVLIAPNCVIFSNCFSGFSGSIRYVNRRGEFHQDVLLGERLDPDLLKKAGFSPDSGTAQLEIWTEFFNAPEPTVKSRIVSGERDPNLRASMAEPDLIEDHLDFGIFKMPTGRAYLQTRAGGESQAVDVIKRWMHLEGRTFLVESIPLTSLEPLFAQLPSGHQQLNKSGRPTLHAGRRAPTPVLARKRDESILLSQTSIRKPTSDQPQLVLDYTTINGSLTNYIFQGDRTYYISGNTSLNGTNTTFEGNAALKYASGVTLTVNTPITWLGDNYRPVALISKDDNSMGESISGSSGNPGKSHYATKALYFDANTASTNLVLKSLRVANAVTAVGINGRAGHQLTDVQLVNCASGLSLSSAEVSLHNALFSYVVTNFTGSSATGHVEHLTSDMALWLNQSIGTNLFLTNCLLTSVTNLGSVTLDHCAQTNVSGVYQIVGGGNYYLATNSIFRDLGTTNISPNVLAELKRTTTYPPIVYSNATISIATTLSPQAQRDTDTPDLGYHYDPMDYAFGGSHASNTLTFAAGTAVGWWHTASGWYHTAQGIQIGDQLTLTFAGTEESPTYWVRCNTVQEQGGNGQWQGGYGPGGITSWNSQAASITNAPTVMGRFLICSGMTSWDNHFRDDASILIGRFRDCEFYGGGVSGYNSSYYLTNCLFVRAALAGVNQGRSGNEIAARNCTWYGAYLYFTPTTAVPVSIRDSAIDGASITASGYAANATYADYAYNAYTNASNPFPVGGTGDQSSVTFNWQIGPLGRFYLPTNSVLIDAGDVTADVPGLYHFTTQTNQVKDGSSTVDICYHYVAVTNGVPIDTDGDGTPDYQEDANGNGSVDSGETDWQSIYDTGLQVRITRPQDGSTIP